jgi:hypothetical protein
VTKVVLVLGAGASLANARYFRPERSQDTHPPLDATFFQKIRARDVVLPSALREYLRGLLGADPTPRLLEDMRMEEFFKDVYYDFVTQEDSVPTRRAYIDLVGVYTRVLRETTNWLCEDTRTGAPVGKLIAAAADKTDAVTVITFNHDLVIENEIFKRSRLRSRWCIDRSYGLIGDTMSTLRSGIPGADFPRHGDGCSHERPIKVLKLHGSLNWVVRLQGRFPSVRQLMGRSAQQDVLLSRRREILARLRYARPTKGGKQKGRGRTTWYTWPVIIPPVYAKQSLIHTVQATWDEAREDLQEAERVVFFGYSLPQADIEAEKLFQRALATNTSATGIEVINPDPVAAERYARLIVKKSMTWFPDVDLFLTQSPFR